MSCNDAIETREVGNHRISIYPDYDAECPVTNWDMGGRYLWEYPDSYHHILSDQCNWEDYFCESRGHTLEDALRQMAAIEVDQKNIVKFFKEGNVQDYRFIYDRHEREWKLQSYSFKQWWDEVCMTSSELKECDYRYELVEHLEKDELIKLIDKYAKDFVIQEWSTRGYSQGDYMEGIAYMSKERFDKYVGFNPDKFKNWKQHAYHIIDLEVKEIGMWAWGDVKGYVLEKKVNFTKVYDNEEHEDEEDCEYEEVDSCWGFYMDTDELIEEVISEHRLKETA